MPLFLPGLKHHGHLDPIHLTICSVGSRKVNEQNDFGSQVWAIFAPNLTIYGFDADADACDAANADLQHRQINWTEHHFPFAIADQIEEATLHVTSDPQCSSLYLPNESFLRRFEPLRELVKLEFTVEIETTTLDAVSQEIGMQRIDFLQIDVQGANLKVLQGASQLLAQSVLGIQVEVEFSELYVGQPLFADVDRFLREHGFALFELSPIARPSRGLVCSVQRPGQILWADGIYLRDPLRSDTDALLKQPDQLLKLACIADALELTDYALELLEYLTMQYGKQPSYNIADTIATSLSQVPGIVQMGIEKVPTIQNLQPFFTQPIPQGTLLETSDSQEPSVPLPIQSFHSNHYLRHNQRRLEHLASLGLNLVERSVLEVGAGIGDHTSFFLDRGCHVTCTEGRPENLEILEQRFPNLPVKYLDLNDPVPEFSGEFDIVYCYGLLYHLHKPAEAIAFMAAHCRSLLLLETCVSFGEHEAINFCGEPAASPTQSISGQGCRPTRPWMFNQLKQHFPFVYMPITQPSHEEFPLDWSIPSNSEKFTRSVFIASKQQLDNPLLLEKIPIKQRH